MIFVENDLVIGSSGVGALNIKNGTMAVNHKFSLGINETGSGIVNIDKGGTLSVGRGIDFGTGQYEFILHGGTLQAYQFDLASDIDIVLGSASSIIDTQHLNVELSGVLSGSGGLVKKGTGVLTLSGINNYTGLTTINSGKFVLSDVGSIEQSEGVIIGEDGLFDISMANTIDGTSITTLNGLGKVNLGEQALILTNAQGEFYGEISGNSYLSIYTDSRYILNGTTVSHSVLLADGILQVGEDNHTQATVSGANIRSLDFSDTIDDLDFAIAEYTLAEQLSNYPSVGGTGISLTGTDTVLDNYGTVAGGAIGSVTLNLNVTGDNIDTYLSASKVSGLVSSGRGGNGLDVLVGHSTINNYGTIEAGSGGDSSSTIITSLTGNTNASAIIESIALAYAGSGGVGVNISGIDVLLHNSGAILGGNGGFAQASAYSRSEQGEHLILLAAALALAGEGGEGINIGGDYNGVVNTGMIIGGHGGSATTETTTEQDTSAGVGGVGVMVSGNYNEIVNVGTITGGQGGSTTATTIEQRSSVSDGGDGVIMRGNYNYLSTSGAIAAGMNGDKTSYGNAVVLSGENNTLELQSGYHFVGNVIASGRYNTLALGGNLNHTFDIATISSTMPVLMTRFTDAQYYGFDTYKKIGTSNWTLFGSSVLDMNWIIEAGVLTTSNTNVFGSGSPLVIDESGVFNLDGYNQTLGQVSNAGLIVFSAPNSIDPTLLNVIDNYMGNGGAIVMNVNLQTQTGDLLSVSGDTSGSTYLSITNTGLSQSTSNLSNGIELIDIGGNSLGRFTLSSPLISGLYEYRLYKNANGNWYLTSLDERGADLMNVNVGGAFANQITALTLFNDSGSRYRRDSAIYSRDNTFWGYYHFNKLDTELLDNRIGTQIKSSEIILGADIIDVGSFKGGAYASYGHASINSHSHQTSSKSTGGVTGYGVGVYADWQESRTEGGLFIESFAHYGWYDNYLKIQGDNRNTDYDSSTFNLTAGVGYGFVVGREVVSQRNWIFKPQLQVGYTWLNTDDFTDSRATHYSDINGDGAQISLGARFYGVKTTPGFGILPYIEGNWIYSGNTGSIKANGQHIDSDIAKNLAEIKTGLSGSLTENWASYAEIGVRLGQNDYTRLGAQIGMSYSF